MNTAQRWWESARASTRVFVRDVGHGLLEVSHNTLALVGLTVIAAAIFVFGRPDLRHEIETTAYAWLQGRHVERAERDGNILVAIADPSAVERATAADPRELTRQQKNVAQWISRRYKVAPEPISRLVKEAWDVGQRAQLDPTLILAIMAVESSFNPFAQSPVGAQGLMQVMTRIHDDKYTPFGGQHAAFDPVTNLRVGVQVLKECIERAGGIQAGLKYYVGAANLDHDGGYAARVMGEQLRLQQAAGGRTAPLYASATPRATQGSSTQTTATDVQAVPTVGVPAAAATDVSGQPS